MVLLKIHYTHRMRLWIAIPFLLLAMASADEFPLLHMGGDGHAYLITGAQGLAHIHRERRTHLDLGPFQGIFPSRTGVFVNAGGRVWLIEEGNPTPVADGHLVELGESEEGAYLLLWDNALKLSFLPY